MKLRLIAIPLALLTAGPASALSCARPDAVTLYEFARDSEDIYSMVIGKISSDKPIAIPKADQLGQLGGGKRAESRVQLSGRSLTAGGFSAAFDETVTLRLSCVSAWCAAPPPLDREVMVTFKHEANDRVIEISACQGNAMPFKPDDEARVMNCHRFDKCERADF